MRLIACAALALLILQGIVFLFYIRYARLRHLQLVAEIRRLHVERSTDAHASLDRFRSFASGCSLRYERLYIAALDLAIRVDRMARSQQKDRFPS